MAKIAEITRLLGLHSHGKHCFDSLSVLDTGLFLLSLNIFIVIIIFRESDSAIFSLYTTYKD